MKGINILMMLICFNIGIFLISATGLYTVGSSSGLDLDESQLSTWGIVIGNLGLTALLTTAGAAGGAIVSFLAGADPIRGGAIGLFAGAMTSMWKSVSNTLLSFGSTIEPAGGIVTSTIIIFMAINGILIFYFFIQFAGGGWKAIE